MQKQIKGGYTAVNRVLKTAVLSLFVFVFVLLTPSVTAQAEEEYSAAEFGVSFSQDGFEQKISWHQREDARHYSWIFAPSEEIASSMGRDAQNIRYLTLPYSLMGKEVYLYSNTSAPFYLDGTEMTDGGRTVLAEGVHTLVTGQERYTLTVRYTSDMPTIYIDTQSGSLDRIYEDKANKESAFFTLVEDGKVTFSEELDYIKGRGNFSWTSVPKKSFSIKFIEDTSVLGLDAAEKFCLLANYIDMSLLKNDMIFSLAEDMGLDFTPQSAMTEVYINSEYMGCYSFMEKVEVSPARVDITPLEQLTAQANKGVDITKSDLMGTRDVYAHTQYGSMKWADIKNNPYDITGGYLLELELAERYVDAVCGFVTDYGQTVAISYPEYATKAQVEYISDWYQQFEQAVISDDGRNSQGKHYSEYIDVESLAKMFVLQEFAKNLDAGLTSFYLYKDTDGLLTAGAIWDMDSTLGREFERFGDNMSDPENLWAANSRLVGEGIETNYTILALLWRHGDFRAEVIKQWNENLSPKLDSFMAEYRIEWKKIEKSLYSERSRWVGAKLTDSQLTQWCSDAFAETEDFVRLRKEYISRVYNENSWFVTYSANGAQGVVTDGNLYSEGEQATVKENWYKSGEAAFLGWNTAADGSGEAYNPGDVITVSEDITLYAQWDRTAAVQDEQGFMAKIISIIKRIFG